MPWPTLHFTKKYAHLAQAKLRGGVRLSKERKKFVFSLKKWEIVGGELSGLSFSFYFLKGNYFVLG